MTTTDDHNPNTPAVRAYTTRALEIATTLDPANPTWAGATTLILNDPYLRDLLLTHIILTRAYDQAIHALQQLPPDPQGNRDMLLAASHWINGNTEHATTIANTTHNRSAQLIGILAATGSPAHTWADTLVRHILNSEQAPRSQTA